jgi:hypothetical protein
MHEHAHDDCRRPRPLIFSHVWILVARLWGACVRPYTGLHVGSLPKGAGLPEIIQVARRSTICDPLLLLYAVSRPPAGGGGVTGCSACVLVAARVRPDRA